MTAIYAINHFNFIDRIVNDGIILKSSACIFVSKKIEKNKFLNLLK